MYLHANLATESHLEKEKNSCPSVLLSSDLKHVYGMQ